MSRWLQSVNTLLEKLDDRVENVVTKQDDEDDDDDDELNNIGSTVRVGSSDHHLGDILAKRGLTDVYSHDEDDDDDHVDNEKTTTTIKVDDGKMVEGEESSKVVKTDSDIRISSTDDGSRLLPTDSTTDDSVKTIPRDDGEGIKEGSTVAEQKNNDNDVIKPDSYSGSNRPDGKGESTPVINNNDGSQSGKVISDPSHNAQVQGGRNDDGGKIKPSQPPSRPVAASSTTTTTTTSAPVTAPGQTVPATPPRKVSATSSVAGASRPPSVSTTPKRTDRERELTAELKEALKEARTLRRHVVALNEQLEAAESESHAQRAELDRAADRMEKDRVRTKEEREATQKRHGDEIALLKAQHDRLLKEQQTRMEEQMDGYRQKLREEENRRRQEGGDWDKEMSQAIEREQTMRQQVSVLEDEKSVLLSHISTLQSQQMTLGSRLESLTQTADNAMARERDAEDRLDAALNQHARQISQRQARESELERTVQELNAALVASRNRKNSSRIAGNGSVGGPDSGNGGSNLFIDARIDALEMDLESANAHLVLERERSETLQTQLRDLSKETTQEATIVHAKQIQYDRQIADMSLTISKLEASLREATRQDSMLMTDTATTSVESASTMNDHNNKNNYETMKQIKELSEEVVRLRDKVATHNSESLAMKHRLRAATDRAQQAEEELAIAKSSSTKDDPDMMYDSLERATPLSSGSRRRKTGTSTTGSIRAAMRLESGHGERSEQIGQVVDAVDSFAVTTGKYLRKNPIARAGFIFYLILIHLWTFALLFFHAHSFGAERCDFQEGVRISHGPHALMMDQNHGVINMAKTAIATNADASGAMIPNAAAKDHDSMMDSKADGKLVDAKDAKADREDQAEIPNE